MAPLRTFIALAGLVAGAGCAHIQPLTLDEPIGPLNSQGSEPDRGSLVVYSDTEANPDDPEYSSHSSYTLYTADGKLVRKVDNRSSSFGMSAVTLALAAGQYKVVARALDYGLVTAPVIVQEGRTTVVDLNQEVLPQSRTARGNWVRLPNGTIVGSRSE